MKNFQAGVLKKHNQGRVGEYTYFLPKKINQEHKLENQRVILALTKASQSLGELKTYGEITPDIDFFIKMHIANESTYSSKIEGTQTSAQDAFLLKNEIAIEKRDDWKEVNNYIKTMSQSIKDLKELPISIRLIKKNHKQLLSGVRGKNKMPGEIRTSQNWIGGSSINSAYFIPPHHLKIANLLSDWENFWHYQQNLPTLIKIALCHYQFETIHPFLDSNGRIGRLLIILQLIEKKLITQPILYLSIFFEKHKQAYYDSLDRVRTTNNIDQWFLFFLEGISNTANKAKTNLEQIIEMKKKYDYLIYTSNIQKKHTKPTLEYLFSNPVITTIKLSNQLKIDYQVANKLIKKFVNLGILKETTGYNRNRIFVMVRYFELFLNE